MTSAKREFYFFLYNLYASHCFSSLISLANSFNIRLNFSFKRQCVSGISVDASLKLLECTTAMCMGYPTLSFCLLAVLTLCENEKIKRVFLPGLV